MPVPINRRPRFARICVVCALGVSIAAALSGCQSASTGTAYFRPEPIAGSMGVVYIYRVEGASGSAVQVVVDNQTRGSIRRGEYLAVPVKAGEHFVRVQNEGSVVRRIELGEGQSRFLEAVVAKWHRQISLDVPSLDVGRDRIVRAKQVPTE